MRIINISHLFKTPVISSVDTQSQISRKKRRRNKGKAQKAICTDASALPAEIQPKAQPVSNPTENSKKRRRRRKPAIENSIEQTPKKPVAKQVQNTQEKSGICDSTKVKPAENIKQEITELKNSLLVLSSKKDTLERKLNELQEENDRLAKNNEDLKDELQEMTEEALELSVEKQRLLGKIGLLKKQLLNKPK